MQINEVVTIVNCSAFRRWFIAGIVLLWRDGFVSLSIHPGLEHDVTAQQPLCSVIHTPVGGHQDSRRIRGFDAVDRSRDVLFTF